MLSVRWWCCCCVLAVALGQVYDKKDDDKDDNYRYNPDIDHRQFGDPDDRRYEDLPPFDPRFPNRPYNPDNPDRPSRRWDEERQRWIYDDRVLSGVLEEWRPDLQGQYRPEVEYLPHDAFVQTNYGKLQGFYVYLYDKPGIPEHDRPINEEISIQRHILSVSVFLGVPYAQPPVDEGRFKPPRPHRGWQLHQAVDYGPACPQPTRYVGETKGIREMKEDCLYLNIFTPSVASNVEALYAVMFYIHGGEFEHGASNLFPAHMLAASQQVVVVTFNYRLGALGFLSTGDEWSPGNYGILDQAMALKWVYDNIYAFNGDKNKITVFGPGAGAASGGLLAVAPKSRKMVKQVIAESGSPLADWAAISNLERARNTSRIYGEKVGCMQTGRYWENFVKCLSKRSYEELGNAEIRPDLGTFPWSPIVDINMTVPKDNWYDDWTAADWRFLPDRPYDLYKNRVYNRNFKYLAGVTRDDMAYYLQKNTSLAPNYEIDEEFFDTKVWEWIKQYNYTLNPDGIFNAIKYMYTYWPDPNNKTHIREQYVHMLSDSLIKAPNDDMIKLLVSQEVHTYMYVLNTTVEALRLPFWREVPHNTEYYFLTGAPFMDKELFPESIRLDQRAWTEGDRNMSEFFMVAFANFAKYGEPTPKQILETINWEMAKFAELKWLSVNNTFNSSNWLNYRQRECTFWTEYLPTVIGRYVPTYPPTTEYWLLLDADRPVAIAFWTVATTAAVLIVVACVACCLWRSARRQNNRLLDDSFLVPEDFISVTENHHVENNKEPQEPVKKRSSSPVPKKQKIGKHQQISGRSTPETAF